jgi:hypothetical protein
VALEATLRSCDEGLTGASAARLIMSAFADVARGSPATLEVSILTSPPTA